MTATVSNNRNSSKDGTYLRSLLLLLMALLILCFLILPQRTDCRTGAKPHSNAQHHAQTQIIYQKPYENAEAQSNGKAAAAVISLNWCFLFWITRVSCIFIYHRIHPEQHPAPEIPKLLLQNSLPRTSQAPIRSVCAHWQCVRWQKPSPLLWVHSQLRRFCMSCLFSHFKAVHLGSVEKRISFLCLYSV